MKESLGKTLIRTRIKNKTTTFIKEIENKGIEQEEMKKTKNEN